MQATEASISLTVFIPHIPLGYCSRFCASVRLRAEVLHPYKRSHTIRNFVHKLYTLFGALGQADVREYTLR